MKPDYKNWVPKGMLYGLGGGALAALVLLIPATLLLHGAARTVVTLLLALGAAALIFVTVLMTLMHRRFSYDGKRQMSRQIVEGTARYVDLPEGGVGLDVGCGSGALTIACAKRNPGARMVGIDRWGAEYASFSLSLCEANAKAEGTANVSFQRGDAVRLAFPDESFDAVTSNYVYHNIPGDRQAYLRETLRVLKKGGSFAIHDIMSRAKYGDITAFADELRRQGYAEVKLIDTTQGQFMSPWEAKWMMLSGSTLLVGRK